MHCHSILSKLSLAKFTAAFCLLVCLGTCNVFAFDGTSPTSDTSIQIVDQDDLVKIFGVIMERSSHTPLQYAHITALDGNQVIAQIRSDINGKFVLTLSRSRLQRSHFALQIKHRNHVFIKEYLRLAAYQMQIEINGQVFLEGGPWSAYQLPVHRMDRPEVATVRTTAISNSHRMLK